MFILEELRNRYDHVGCRKSEGAHYTPTKLSTYISKQMLEKFPNLSSQRTIRIADPAIGDGELVLSLLTEIGHTNQKIIIYGFDINEKSLAIAQQKVTFLHPNVEFKAILGDFLVTQNEVIDNGIKFDLIIANPPYVRTQVMGSEKSGSLAKQFDLKGRVDLYQAFLIATSKLLTKEGVAGFVVSNRFMSTKGSGWLRSTLYNLYSFHKIVDFGDTKLFDSAVLPAVMTFSLKNESSESTEFSSVYESEGTSNCESLCETPIDALDFSGIISCSNGKAYEVKHGLLIFDNEASDVWRMQDESSKAWLDTVNKNTAMRFKDVGKVRVGIKTTADKVFIKEDWFEEVGYLPELARPLITHHVAGRYQQSQDRKTKSVLYTHTEKDGAKVSVELERYPLSLKYLSEHKEQLSSRKYIEKAKREWFEIWVPQNPSLWKNKKVVFRDICEQPTFWMDESGSVVNGDCYWIIKDNPEAEDDSLILLLAIANSTFIERYYDTKFNNKLYSNKRRFMSQYVEDFPLPSMDDPNSHEIVKLTKERMDSKSLERSEQLEKDIDLLVLKVFGLA